MYRFAPEITLVDVRAGVLFYQQAFGATLLRQFDNPDQTIHVAEMEVGGAMFHIHDEVPRKNRFAPTEKTSILLGLFVDDVHQLVNRAEKAGASIVEPVRDYEYGFRQAVVKDPFGYFWMIEMKL